MSKCQLYRHYDADGKLLYVGISNSETKRRKQHKFQAKWFAEIARVEVADFDDRDEAAAAEKAAIAVEKPQFNIESRREISEKPEAKRKRLERERMRQKGYVLRQAWVHPKDWEQVQKFLLRVNTRRDRQ